MVIGLGADRVADDKRLHAAVWPGVLKTIGCNGRRSFDIFISQPERLLSGTSEYLGDDVAASGRAIAADCETQRGWRECEPYRRPLSTAKPGAWWAMIDNNFPMDGR
jgi:L-rhamnose mutarotase